jgi:hypothetical protein
LSSLGSFKSKWLPMLDTLAKGLRQYRLEDAQRGQEWCETSDLIEPLPDLVNGEGFVSVATANIDDGHGGLPIPKIDDIE